MHSAYQRGGPVAGVLLFGHLVVLLDIERSCRGRRAAEAAMGT